MILLYAERLWRTNNQDKTETAETGLISSEVRPVFHSYGTASFSKQWFLHGDARLSVFFAALDMDDAARQKAAFFHSALHCNVFLVGIGPDAGGFAGAGEFFSFFVNFHAQTFAVAVCGNGHSVYDGIVAAGRFPTAFYFFIAFISSERNCTHSGDMAAVT